MDHHGPKLGTLMDHEFSLYLTPWESHRLNWPQYQLWQQMTKYWPPAAEDEFDAPATAAADELPAAIANSSQMGQQNIHYKSHGIRMIKMSLGPIGLQLGPNWAHWIQLGQLNPIGPTWAQFWLRWGPCGLQVRLELGPTYILLKPSSLRIRPNLYPISVNYM